MSYRSTKLPLLLERAGVRRVKPSIYIPLIQPETLALLSLWRRGSRTCADTYAFSDRIERYTKLLL
jgi:hypothetical protein